MFAPVTCPELRPPAWTQPPLLAIATRCSVSRTNRPSSIRSLPFIFSLSLSPSLSLALSLSHALSIPPSLPPSPYPLSFFLISSCLPLFYFYHIGIIAHPAVLACPDGASVSGLPYRGSALFWLCRRLTPRHRRCLTSTLPCRSNTTTTSRRCLPRARVSIHLNPSQSHIFSIACV